MQLTRAMALEWARYGIRVNALCPGYIETALNSDFFQSEPGLALIRRIPQRRIGQPEYLDGAMLLLASDLGTFITGADLAVAGGHLVSTLKGQEAMDFTAGLHGLSKTKFFRSKPIATAGMPTTTFPKTGWLRCGKKQSQKGFGAFSSRKKPAARALEKLAWRSATKK